MSASSNPLSATALIKRVFYGVAQQDLSALRAVAEPRRYPMGTILCHQGEVERVFYIISEGAVVIYHALPGEPERVVDIKRAGEFFGEMALINNTPRTASVRAASELTVLEITEEVFDEVLMRSPAVALTIMRQMARSVVASDQRAIEDLQEKNKLLAQAYEELKRAQAQLVEREALKRELEVAAAVQQGLLPHSIEDFMGFAFAGRNIPARHIGGDLYDVLRVDDTHVGLLLADVSDKSVHAALYMAITKALFLTAAKHELSPARVAYQVHEGLMEVSETDEMFVTAFYGILDCVAHTLCYVRAGQERPIWLHADGSAPEKLPGDGRFLGQLEGLVLTERTFEFQAGDMLVMYSDGIPDATNAQGASFMGERLMAEIAGLRRATADETAQAIIERVLAHQGTATPFDDMTLLVLQDLHRHHLEAHREH